MPRILISEDERAIVKLIEFGLRHLGYETLWAQDGREALVLARANQPDLILLDVMMPIMDGFEVLARLRDDEATRLIPVVILTAYGQDLDAEFWAARGAQDYVLKPFSFTDLSKRLQVLLSSPGAVRSDSPLR
jgi:CheY-like chemotaxis protein